MSSVRNTNATLNEFRFERADCQQNAVMSCVQEDAGENAARPFKHDAKNNSHKRTWQQAFEQQCVFNNHVKDTKQNG